MAAVTDAAGADPAAQLAICRPFFITAIVSVLTSGCALGAVALVALSQQRVILNREWTLWIAAHANSQLFGWVGLFVMGFSLQLHTPRPSRADLFRLLAALSLASVAIAIPLRFAAEALWLHSRAAGLLAGAASCLLEVVAVAAFIVNIGMTRRRVADPVTGRPAGLPWQSVLLFTALAWWLAAAAAETIFFVQSHQPQGARFVAEWDMPLRDAQFLGFVVNMIFGVVLVRLHTDFGAPTPSRNGALAGFGLWNLGVVLRVVAWPMGHTLGLPGGPNPLYFVGGAALAAGAAALVWSARPFAAPANRLPSHKFLRAALAWLLASAAILLAEPIYLRLAGAGFEHAIVSAFRHAAAVGLISQMIVAVSIFQAARFRGLEARAQSQLWSVYWLLNGGNALRVAGALLTPLTPLAYSVMAPSGAIEAAGILLWAVWLVPTLTRRRAAALS
ncbi:MAG: hypothetical protein KGJ62_02340 [Armatimonadetes bacterium]|nr:hypothetical protein [Armatimonadota bacterium]MDE2205340.1 hypothetical protein [Armatimonadota bacterium]